MSTICSPVKLTPPSAKKGRPSIDWQRCIICQVFTAERLCIPTTKGRSTFISAVNKRKDEVYRKLVENTPFGNTKYHKSCYKAFTSKQNLSTCSTRPTSASCNQNPSSNEDNFTIVTRSRSSEIDWTACIFCKHKAFKHDRKMHKVSSENRTQSIKRVAEQISQWNDLQSDVWRLCRKCFVSFSVYNTIFA
jgi:hypothetical protein